MQSVFREITSIQTSVKAALSSIEPKIVALPVPNHRIPKYASPGEILAAVKTHQSADPIRDLKTIKSAWSHTLRKTKSRLNAVEATGYKMQRLLNHIENGSDLPDGMDEPQLLAAARSLRTAKQSGADVGATLDRARRSITSGLDEVRRIKNNVVPNWENTASTILYKHGSIHFEKCSAAEPDLDVALRLELKAATFWRLHERCRQKNLNRARDRDKRRMAGVILKSGVMT